MGYSVLKSAKIVPEEVDRLKEIGELKEQIKGCADENKKKILLKAFNEKILAFNLIMGRNRRRK